MYAFSLSVFGLVTGAIAKGVWTTPHDKYSSSIGVLGCKINTNRVAYWPGSVDCNNICVKLSYEGRSVNLLRIDQSGGAYDVSYDAWVYLQTGNSATKDPISGGSVAMEYEEVDASECADLIYTKGSKLPLSASNSINYLSSCLDQPNSWVAQNHVLFNICDAICTVGYDEECSLDLATSNQPSCPHTLGLTTKLNKAPVYDIEYASGKKVVAGSGEEAPAGAQIEKDPKEDSRPASTQDSVPRLSTLSTTVTGGIFQELPTASQEPGLTSSSPGLTFEPSSSSVPTSSTSQDAVTTETSSSAIQLPTSVPLPPTPHNATATHSVTISYASPSSSSVHTTLSVSTVSVGRNPSSTSSPLVQDTPKPESAGRRMAGVPISAVASGFVVCFLGSLL